MAPLVIEENSVVGAGSVITRNITKNSLALTRSPQINKKNYKNIVILFLGPLAQLVEHFPFNTSYNKKIQA